MEHATLLLIDDDDAVRATFSEALRLAGFDVRTATDGGSALRSFAECHHDAILVDLRMPFGDGMTFIRKLRALGGHVPPIAVITGDYFVDDAVVEELRGLGIEVAYKPLWNEDLITLANTLVDRAERDGRMLRIVGAGERQH
jgi:two-component system OmpR family response regulator